VNLKIGGDKMKYKKLYFNITKFFILLLLGISIGTIIGKTILLATDDTYYGFPAVTKCRICNKTVWIWQPHERREYNAINTGNYPTIVHANGIVHKHCKGTPNFEINISVGK
jgi:hypothetical protein